MAAGDHLPWGVKVKKEGVALSLPSPEDQRAGQRAVRAPTRGVSRLSILQQGP